MSEQSEKRKNDELENDQMEAEDESNSEEEEDDESSDESNEEVEQVGVEFEAYSPSPEDREGIQALLKQLFKKEPVELGLLTEHLLNEKSLCTVVKQLIDEVVDEDDDVFSFSSLIQLNRPDLIDKPFIKLISRFLLRTAKETNGGKQIAKLLEDRNQHTVLVLNERFINLPPKLGVMSLQNLLDEIKNLEINYFIFICKLLRSKGEASIRKEHNKRSKATDESGLIYLNGEDEVLAEHALEKYEFKIADDHSDLSVQQNWKSGQQFVPYRKVLLLDRNGLNSSLNKLKEEGA